MPFEYGWKLVYADCSIMEIETFLDAQKTYGTPTGQHSPCTVCAARVDTHKMHYAIYACQSATCEFVGDGCEWHAMSKLCESTGRGILNHHGHHLPTIRWPPRPELNQTQKRLVRNETSNRLTPSRILNKMIDRFKLDNTYPLLSKDTPSTIGQPSCKTTTTSTTSKPSLRASRITMG